MSIPSTKHTPMTDMLSEIDRRLEKQIQECIKLANEQRKRTIKAFIERGIYE